MTGEVIKTIDVRDSRDEHRISGLVRWEKNVMGFENETRRVFEFHGHKVMEALFPRPDHPELKNWKTLLWTLEPMDIAFEEDGTPRPLFHISFQHNSDEDLNKAVLAVEEEFKNHYKIGS